MSFIVEFIDILCTILIFAIIARAILSWFPNSRGNRLVILLHQITDPILEPLRKIIPPIGGTIDISPLIVIVALQIISWWANSLA